MHRRQAYRRQGGTASLRPVCWLVLLGVVAATVGAWLAVGTAAPQQAAAPVTVAIQVLQFVPQDITVPVGTRVAWVNDGGRHQIVADNGALSRSSLLPRSRSLCTSFVVRGCFPITATFTVARAVRGCLGSSRS